jgi:hypothetical protein
MPDFRESRYTFINVKIFLTIIWTQNLTPVYRESWNNFYGSDIQWIQGMQVHSKNYTLLYLEDKFIISEHHITNDRQYLHGIWVASETCLLSVCICYCDMQVCPRQNLRLRLTDLETEISLNVNNRSCFKNTLSFLV